MTRFAVVTIEMPLDGGEIEDAQVLANIIEHRSLTKDPARAGLFGAIYGQVVTVEIEDRDRGMGRARATALRREIDNG